MVRRTHQARRQLAQGKDALLVCVALWLAHAARAAFFRLLPQISYEIQPFSEYIGLWFVLLPGAPLFLEAVGFYDRPTLARRRTTLWLLTKGCAIMTFTLILLTFLAKMNLARSVILLSGPFSVGLVFLHSEILRAFYRSRLGREQYRDRFILIGTREDARQLRKEMATGGDDAVDFVAELEVSECTLDRLTGLLHEHGVNGVMINAQHTVFGEVERVVQICELEGVEAWLVADFFKTKIYRRAFDEFRGRPMLVFQTGPKASWQGLCKSLLDFFGALLGLVGLSWLFVLVALLIKLTSPGPVFFRQQRSGLHGRPFTMYKFRSMGTDAEQRKHELESMNEMSGPVFKVTNDPRVTPIGKLLRRTSIDEMPQLWNVLLGQMSLVGPRPLPVEEVRRFTDLAHRRRLSVKPGLTCLWQISGRNNVCDFQEWVRLDLEYIDQWSLWLDLKILAKTLPAVVRATGAK